MVSAGTGFGKTLIGVEYAKRKDVNVVLVIAPINTFKHWTEMFTRQEFAYPAYIIDSSETGKANYARLERGEPGAYVIGTQMYYLSSTDGGKRKPWTNWTKATRHIDMAILDESHKASNRKSLLFTEMKRLRVTYKLAMSATPSGNKFEGMFAPAKWLWPNLIPAFWNWRATWCATEYSPHTQSGDVVVGEKNPGEFVKSLPCYIYYAAPKKPTDTYRVEVEMTPAQRKMYDQMEAMSLAWLDEHPLVADLPIVQKTRLRQMALGEVTVIDNGEVDADGLPKLTVTFADDCASGKIDTCHKIIDRHPGEAIIFYTDSQKFAAVLAKRLGPLAREWSGAVSKTKRTKIMEAFASGEVKYIVATVSSIGTGTDGLQLVCSTEVWCNKSFNGVDNTQAEGRLNRTGQPAERITRYELVSAKSDDAAYLDKLVANRVALNSSLNH